MSFTIEHVLEVDAPPATVWQVITDLASYGEWNPFVRSCESSLQPGDPIKMKVKLLGPPQPQEEVILEHVEGKTLAYRMKPFPLGALSSRRSHEIEDLGNGRTRYRSHFQLQGWMMPLVRGLLGGRMQAGFTGMSEGIKSRAEQLAA